MAFVYQGQEVVYLDMTVRVLGARLIGLREVKYTFERELEALYGEGGKVRGIQAGNEKLEGNLKILKNDFDLLDLAATAAGYTNITDVPYQLIVITVNYKAAFGRPMKTDILSGVKFSKFDLGMAQNAKMMEIELPFLFMDLART